MIPKGAFYNLVQDTSFAEIAIYPIVALELRSIVLASIIVALLFCDAIILNM